MSGNAAPAQAEAEPRAALAATAVQALAERIRQAAARGTALCIRGGASKDFHGRRCDDLEVLSTGALQGVINYRPSELVITAWAGTRLAALEATLAAQGQALAFEPPHFGDATVGGTVACGLAGPRRPFGGSLRDHLLGVGMINGRGEVLRFGGEVIKNVAGYDVPRLMAGAMGTLGLLLYASLRVVPAPAATLYLWQPMATAAAWRYLRACRRRALPLSGACYADGVVHLRLQGSTAALAAAQAELDFDEQPDGAAWWQQLREQRLAFFADDRPLWRLALTPDAARVTPPAGLLDWAGCQYWIKSEEDSTSMRARYGDCGQLSCFRGGDRTGEVFAPLPAALAELHRRVKHAFDPAGVLNPGRLYRWL